MAEGHHPQYRECIYATLACWVIIIDENLHNYEDA